MDVRTWVHGSDPSAGSRPRGTRGTPSAIRSTWWVTWWVAVGCAVLAGATIGGVDAAAVERRPVHDVRVIVRTEQGATGDVVARARELGAREVEVLPFVDSFSSTMPATTADRLRVDADVVTVVPDGAVTVQGGGGSGARGSKYLKAIGADHVHRRGVTGRGVTVALVDTGVTAVDDLRGRLVQVTDDLTGEVAPCANFSGEPTCDDGYGHGTFLAGIIAGDGSASRGAHVGVAPAANVLSVKVAGRNGATDVSTVLSAIQWVVSFKDRYDISVLNLSLGTDSTASTTSDPLNYAVERAWESGIVVVVAASNRGPAPATISKPADDPWVVTVGSTDDRGTAPLHDDRLPLFSSRGPTVADGWAKPDLVAPGAHLVSLRSPGSEIDAHHPDSIAGAYRRGSGTSMSAAVVSGAVALALEAHPSATPDQIKHALRATARPVASIDPFAVGAGALAVDAVALGGPPTGSANVGLPRSTGRGDLDPSRGSVVAVVHGPIPSLLTGLLTAQLLTWDPLGFTTGEWTARTWYVDPRASARWYPVDWSGSNWGGSNWGGSNWGGSEWYGHVEGESYGTTWRGGAWYGAWS